MAKPAKNQNQENCRIITPEFRVSFPHVFKPAQVNGKGDPKYSITMLFKKPVTKKEKEDFAVVQTAIRNAKIAAFGEDKADWPEDLQSAVQDGDSPKNAKREGYKGCWAIKAISNESSKPGLVDMEGDDIIEPGAFYPGCYARAQIFARVWEFSGKQGVHFILDHVQKTRDGKSLSNRKSAKDVFSSAPAIESDDNVSEDDDTESNDFM